MPSHMSEAAAQCDQLIIAKNAPLNFQNAQKNAPTQNVNFFIAFLNVLEGVQKSIFQKITKKSLH